MWEVHQNGCCMPHPTNCVCQLNCFGSACPLMSKGLLSFVFFLQCHASGMPACPYADAPPRCPDGECSWSDSQAMDCEASTHQTSQEECTAKKLNYSLSESWEQTWCASLWSGWYTQYDGSQQFLHCTTQSPAGPPFRYLHSTYTEWLNTGHEEIKFGATTTNDKRGWAFWILSSESLLIVRAGCFMEWRHLAIG